MVDHDAEARIGARVRRLREIADSLPVWQRPNFREPAREREISLLEASVGAMLPDGFRAFLLLTDAVIAMEIHNGLWIGGVPELRRSVERGEFPAAIDERGTPVPAMPVATDGGGNAFLTSAHSGLVWRWDHETGDLRLVSDGFDRFLGRVAEDWVRFARDDRDWSFLT